MQEAITATPRKNAVSANIKHRVTWGIKEESIDNKLLCKLGSLHLVIKDDILEWFIIAINGR